MLDRHVERTLSHRDVVHAVTKTAIGQAMLAHVEAIAFAAEQIVHRDFEILDLHFRMSAAQNVRQGAFGGHGLDVANDLVAGIR